MNCGGRYPARMATVARGPLRPCWSTAWTCSRYSLLGVSGCTVVLISPERRSTSKHSSPPVAYDQKELLRFEIWASGFWFLSFTFFTGLIKQLRSEGVSSSVDKQIIWHGRASLRWVESSIILFPHIHKAKEDPRVNPVVRHRHPKVGNAKALKALRLNWPYIGSNPTRDSTLGQQTN